MKIDFCLLYYCAIPIFGKNIVPEIWGKFLSANPFVGFENQLYMPKKIHEIA